MPSDTYEINEYLATFVCMCVGVWVWVVCVEVEVYARKHVWLR